MQITTIIFNVLIKRIYEKNETREQKDTCHKSYRKLVINSLN